MCIRDRPIFVEYSLLFKKHLSFAGARWQMNTKLYRNRPERHVQLVKFVFGTHDDRIYYINIDLRHQYGISAAESRRSSARNVPSGVERGETDVFAG